MSEKMYLHLLIFCGILSQGIIATSDGDTIAGPESSNFLVRKRRVITHIPEGLTPTRIEEAHFMVVIRENNRAVCAGVILSVHTVLTVAHCVTLHESFYKISAGSVYYKLNTMHNVTSKVEHYGYAPHQQFDGIALLTVDPPFVYSARIGNINLYAGPLPTGTRVTVYGWGCSYPPRRGPTAAGQRVLRSITLPTINLGQCENIYLDHYRQNKHGNIDNLFKIKLKHLCTYDPEQYCARTDPGAPLVFNNKLAGIHVWKGEFESGMNPDVFIDLQWEDYRSWISENMR